LDGIVEGGQAWGEKCCVGKCNKFPWSIGLVYYVEGVIWGYGVGSVGICCVGVDRHWYMPEVGNRVAMAVQNLIVVEMDLDAVFVKKSGASGVAELGNGEKGVVV
jgi:hypothetical protein